LIRIGGACGSELDAGFGRQLHGRFRLPVNEVDERYSTTDALAEGVADVDAASAAVILDQFLRQLR